MSLQETKSTKDYNSIPIQCRNCSRAIYTIENNSVFYQCNLFGTFNQTCKIKTASEDLKSPNDLLNKKKEV